MTPVISPWVFYLMPVCEKFSILSWITFGVSATVCLFIMGSLTFDYLDDDSITKLKRALKILVVLMIITALFACLIPNEETITKMIVAQNVTVDRVNMVSDTVVTVYNDIMNLFSGATNG